jgi:RecB family exonuclease
VFLGTVRQALGMRFDEVFVVGMNEAAFPRAAREDPLLPDRVRETGHVRLCVDQAAEDRRDYLAMLAAADRVTLACSRSDPRAGREQMPCAWYLDAASTLAGRRVFSRDLASFADSPWITAVPSFHDALLASPQPASVQEHRLGGMLHAWIRGDDAPNLPVALTHGLQCVRERAGETFTRWDGLLPAHAARSIRGRAPVSPTSLQTWAKCPFQYFLARVLRVAETDKPEDALEIRGKDRGEVYHRALEAFFRKRLGELMPDTAWTKDDQAELLEIAMEAARSLEAAGVGEAFSWRLEKGALRRGLRAFLQHDQQLRSSNRLHPVALEFSFGIGQEAGAGEIALEDGHTVRFMGRIDRVDRAGDGTLWVWDYKSGQAKHYAQMSADPVDHGKLLQLPVYALGIGSAFESEGIEARYWFITNPGSKGANIKGYPVDAAVLERFRHVIGVIASGIDGGVFAARPGSSVYGGFENCAFCPYDSVCHPDRERIWERKRSDPALAGYAALAEDQSI